MIRLSSLTIITKIWKVLGIAFALIIIAGIVLAALFISPFYWFLLILIIVSLFKRKKEV